MIIMVMQSFEGVRTSDNYYGVYPNSVCSSAKIDMTKLQYQKLSHVNYKISFKLAKKELVNSLRKREKFGNTICGQCQQDK